MLTSETTAGNTTDYDYANFLARVGARFVANTTGRPVFTTDCGDSLWEAYLLSFPEGAERQHHDCSACRHFIHRWAGLVVIDPATGVQRSAVWDPADAPEQYRLPLERMQAVASAAKVTGPFLSGDPILGSPQTGEWRHLHVANQSLFRAGVLTAGQTMAERREDFKNMQRALQEFPAALVAKAVALLEGDALYRSEKVLGPAKWLADLHAALEGKHGQHRQNLLWHAVATAPAGFAHPRSSMIGTLLEDLQAGKSFEAAAAAFKAKMHPLLYQRPQAAPSAGAIAQAEKAFAAMGAERSLLRRFARLDEVDAIWRPAPPKNQPAGSGGIFGHLTPKGAVTNHDLNVPITTMTWDKFRRTVLGEAAAVEALAPGMGTYRALLTAADPDAPPILQWDSVERRNPVNWYLWHGGSSASQWGLSGGAWVPVTAVCLCPAHWYGREDEFAHQGKHATFLLEGARESRNAGLSLFPEILRSEFHGVRSVIEAHSRSGTLEGMSEGSACGLDVIGATVRVSANGITRHYRIDRWD